MKKCILVPDSFKGTMSSVTVSEIMGESIRRHFPRCKIIAIPVADGGEGTVECFLRVLGGEKVYTPVKDPFMKEIDSFYGISGNVAIIEVAAAVGLPLAMGRMNPMSATTYGVGQLIKDAIEKGCRKIILGLGGSCTNDAGAGMAAALGTRFIDARGCELIPAGGTLSQVAEIDISETKKLMRGIEIVAMCDIDNPMYGENGAAYVFAPQKGADKETVVALDAQLRSFAEVIQRSLGVDVSSVKGAGAAGAMGAGVYALLGGKLKQGIDTVLDLAAFDQLLEGCDWVFTGEGKLDSQSLSGKVVIGVSARAKRKNVPVIAVVGTKEGDLEQVFEKGVTRVYETNKGRKGFSDIQEHCREDLRETMEEILSGREFISQYL